MSDRLENKNKSLPKLPRIGPQKRFSEYTQADFQARLEAERELKKEKYSEQILNKYMENFEIGLRRRVEAAIAVKSDGAQEQLAQAVPTMAQTIFQNPWASQTRQPQATQPDTQSPTLSSRERSDADLKSRREIERAESLSSNVGQLVVQNETALSLLKELREAVKELKDRTGGNQGNQDTDIDLRRRRKTPRVGGGRIGKVGAAIGAGLAIVGGTAAAIVGGAIIDKIAGQSERSRSESVEEPDIAFPQVGSGASGPEGTDVDGLGLRQESEVPAPEVQPQTRPAATNIRAESGTFRRAGSGGSLTVPYERTADGKHYIDGREVDAQTYDRFRQLTSAGGDPRRDPRHRQYTEEERARGDDFAPEFTADRRIRDEDNAELSRIIQTVRTQPRVDRPAAPASPPAAPVPAVSPPSPRSTPDASGPEGSDVGGLGLAAPQPPPAVPAATPAQPAPPVAGPRISSGRPSRITGPRPAPVLGEGGDLAGGFAGAADTSGMGLTQQTPAAPAATPVTPARDFGREFGMATEARATAEQELANFRETAGPARVREGMNLQQETYYEDTEVNEQYQALKRRTTETRAQERRIQEQNQSSALGLPNNVRFQDEVSTGRGEGRGPAVVYNRMLEILKSRFNYTDEQISQLSDQNEFGLGTIGYKGRRISAHAIRSLFERHMNEDLVRSAHESALQNQSDAATVPPSPFESSPALIPPAPVAQEPVSPAAAAPAPRTGNMLSRLFSRSFRPRETPAPVLGQGGEIAAVGDAGAMGLEPVPAQREIPRTIADAQRLWPPGHVEDLSGLVRSRLTTAGQPERFEEVMEAMIKLLPNGLSRSNFLNESLLRDYLIANPGRRTEANELMERAGEAMQRGGQETLRLLEQQQNDEAPVSPPSDLARTISNRETVSEALMPKDTVNQVDPLQYLKSDLLLKARKITFKGDEIEFLSGSMPMSTGGLIPPSVFGGEGGGQVSPQAGGSGMGPVPSIGSGGQAAEGGVASQATPAGTAQAGDVSGLKFAPGVDKRISDDIAQKVKQTETASGESLTITSGFRDPARNAAAGGARNSVHTTGKAVDVRFQGGVEDTVKLIQKASASGISGIGVYRPGFVHLDTGPKRVWGPDYTAKSIPDWAKTALQEHMTGQSQSSGGNSDASAVSSAGPSMSAESIGSSGGSAATPVESSSGSGAGLVSASTEAEVQDRSPPAMSQPVMESMPDSDASNPSLTTSQYSHDPNDPGSVEPEDAAERYARLFNMAA